MPGNLLKAERWAEATRGVSGVCVRWLVSASAKTVSNCADVRRQTTIQEPSEARSSQGRFVTRKVDRSWVSSFRRSGLNLDSSPGSINSHLAKMSSSGGTTGAVDLYSAWFCPFAQRAWMALEEKRVGYRLVEIDPYDKTPEFLAANPRGLVPTIRCEDGTSVYESTICVEFVDEAWDDGKRPKLFPQLAYERAVARIWVDFVGRRVVPCFYKILQSQDAANQDKYKKEMLEHIKEFTKTMASDGDFFMGKSLGAVDIALAPFAWRFGILKHYRQFEVPNSPEYERFHKWWKAVQDCPSFQATTCDYDKLVVIYERYSNDTAQSLVAKATRTGGTLP